MSSVLQIFDDRSTTTDEDVSNFLKQDLVVAMFSAPWCGPCHRMTPTVEKLASESTQVKFCKVNIETFMKISDDFNITVVPTFIFFYKGVGVYKLQGGGEEKLRAGMEILKKMETGNVKLGFE